MPRRALLALVLAACAEGAGPGVEIDAAPGTPDAAVRPDAPEADAAPGTPDAKPAIDAAPGTPDARPVDAAGTPDARPVDAAGTPDARPIDAAVVPDAAGTPDAASCTRTWQSLLSNGNFDSGHTVWVESPASSVISNNAAFSPQSGTYYGFLGGFDGADEIGYQTVAIPGTATQVRVSGYRCFVTLETTTTTPYDHLTITLENSGGTVFDTLVSYSNLNAGASCGWSSFTFTDTSVSAYAGTSVRFLVEGTTDGSSITTFLIDTRVFEAYACP